MRAAMVGGAAYYGGKRTQENRYREESQEARLQEPEGQQYAPPMQAAPMAAPPVQAAPPAPGGTTDDTIEQLTKLGQLRDAGVLTDDEFAEQKRRLLA